MDLNQMLSEIEGGNDEEIERLLQRYNSENNRTFTFDQKEESLRIKLCQSTLAVLRREVPFSCQRTCLETLRIMSRDKCVLSPVATREGILTLSLSQNGLQEDNLSEEEERVVVEALKCLCNVMFNSPTAQQICVDVQLAPVLCGKLHSADTWHHEVGLFTLRLLFLLSALRPDLRMCLRKDCQAVTLLTKMLEHTLDINWWLTFTAENNERVMEALKALFNLTLNEPEGEEDVRQCRVIVSLLRHVLMLKTETVEKTEELHSHAVNLLNNLPVSCLDGAGRPACASASENLKVKPEIGNTMRNKLVRLMTHVDWGFDIMSGCEEEPRPNPSEDMTEEQKEYEAEKLFKIITELTRHDMIRPMVVRPDGQLGSLEDKLREIANDDDEANNSDSD
ncbi:hypothetical protein WMY93_032619 [Mugilogobius chulae]|uniref:Synembryn n=1 Tax=Mugilogobius chulae TaxID=88201 RepID=A0AAW0MNK7_9GOBI